MASAALPRQVVLELQHVTSGLCLPDIVSFLDSPGSLRHRTEGSNRIRPRRERGHYEQERGDTTGGPVWQVVRYGKRMAGKRLR